MGRLVKQKKSGEEADGLIMFESMMQRAEKTNTVLDPERMASNGAIMLFAGMWCTLPASLVATRPAQSALISEKQYFEFLTNMAGTETTALALSTAIFHLTKQPDLWLELDRQLRTSLSEGSVEEYLDITALEKILLLEAVAKESLRVSCPISGRLPRNVPEEGWQFKGELLPAGVRQTKPSSPSIALTHAAIFSTKMSRTGIDTIISPRC